jgi:hypothetical protein
MKKFMIRVCIGRIMLLHSLIYSTKERERESGEENEWFWRGEKWRWCWNEGVEKWIWY